MCGFIWLDEETYHHWPFIHLMGNYLLSIDLIATLWSPNWNFNLMVIGRIILLCRPETKESFPLSLPFPSHLQPNQSANTQSVSLNEWFFFFFFLGSYFVASYLEVTACSNLRGFYSVNYCVVEAHHTLFLRAMERFIGLMGCVNLQTNCLE